MNWRDPRGMFESLFRLGALRRTPITDEEVREIGAGMPHRRTWTCRSPGCTTAPAGFPKRPATLTIRAREPRVDGPSNFYAHPPGHNLAGHSVLPSGLLTWNGLAEERGWETDPVVCPACQRGMKVVDYRKVRRQEVMAYDQAKRAAAKARGR